MCVGRGVLIFIFYFQFCFCVQCEVCGHELTCGGGCGGDVHLYLFCLVLFLFQCELCRHLLTCDGGCAGLCSSLSFMFSFVSFYNVRCVGMCSFVVEGVCVWEGGCAHLYLFRSVLFIFSV